MTGRPRYRALVVDLDGTVIDSAPAMQRIAENYLTGLGAAPLSLGETRRFIGDGARVFVTRMLAARGIAADGEALDAHYAAFHALYAEAPPDDNVPYADAFAVLERLGAAGLAVALCTNKPAAPTRNVIDAFAIAPLFGAVVTGDTLPEKKPHPAPLRHALTAIGADVAGTLFVGDSEVDADTAAAVGMDFALHAEGYARAPETIASVFRFARWSELEAFVRPATAR